MSAMEAYQARRSAFENELKNAEGLPAVAKAYAALIARVQQDVMTGIPDETLRQEAGLLFATLADARLPFSTLPAPAISLPEASAPTGGKLGRLARAVFSPAGLGMLLVALTALSCVMEKETLGAALAILALAALLFAAYRRRGATDAALPAPRAFQPVDTARFAEETARLMQGIDRHIEELSFLNGQLTGTPEGVASQECLQLCQRLWEARETRAPAALSASADAAGLLLRRYGLRFAEYGEDTAAWYDTLPSRTENRTIRPAIVRLSDGAVVSRGLAAAPTRRRAENAG